LWRQRQNRGCGVGGQSIDGRGLPVGGDEPLGLASKKILLANSSCWDGSHHELGECGLPRSCERRAREPSPSSDEVHGSRRQHGLKVRFGETDIAGAPQMQDPDACRNRSLDASALSILF
jgi:hypothetical protein